MPEATRLLLLVVALNDGDRVSEVPDAGSAVARIPLDLGLIEAAIVDLDVQSVRFRHPLMPSAVRQSARPEARDLRTAQELQIAQLAAEGLSNREIAQRLYLSHRTIGTHLYRIFPKLGITARGQLASALSVPTAPQAR